MSVSPNFAFTQDGEDASEEDRRQQRYVDAKERWKSNPKPGRLRLEESEDEEASTDRRVRQRASARKSMQRKKAAMSSAERASVRASNLESAAKSRAKNPMQRARRAHVTRYLQVIF
ncbi:hypothetical protein BDZ89DRAFT_1148220 [Hymenopellis radicata]|nr:hypothetical protein BDZ89DRAFT_1148220 [Hymenopellis radicata]